MTQMQTKILLIITTLFLFACGQKTKPTDNNVETQLDTAAKPPKQVVKDTITVKFPCASDIIKNKNYKNDTKGFFVRLTSICLENSVVVDMLQNSDEQLVLAENHHYKHTVFLQTGNDSATYTITKDLVKLDNLTGNEVLINPLMPEPSFEPKDNSITILFTFSEPNATEIRKVKFKVSLKEGVKFMGGVDGE